jgi:hypothetical protein
MAEKQILAFGTGPVPRNRLTKDSERFALLVVEASFNGSGAASDYVPTVTILSDSGDLVGRFPLGQTVSAGSDADVTFAPFLRNDTGLRGIFYDTLNVGGFLNVRTTNNLNPDGGGVTFEVEQSEFAVYVTDAATGAFRVEAPFVIFNLNSAIYRVVGCTLMELNVDDFSVIATNTVGLQTQHSSLNIDANEDVRIQVDAGQTFTVTDHLGNPKIQWTEGTTDLHIPAGGVVVADL